MRSIVGAGHMLDDTDLVLKQGDVGEDGDEAEINVNLFDGTRRKNGVPVGTGAVLHRNRLRWQVP